MARRRKKQVYTVLAVLILCVVLVLLYASSVLSDYRGSYSGELKQVTILEGSSTADIAAALKEQGIIKNPLWFRVFSKLGGHDGSFQQGTYMLQEKAGYQELYETLKKAPVTDAVKVTIPEGFELRQIADRLEEAGLINRERFYKAVENGDFDYDFLKNLPKRENRLEGYLFPDTYLFQPGESEEAILNKMLSRFNEVYTQTYRDRAKELGMTDDELITLASIIEREAQ
ncbi:MAG: endolytic transglycosylase MltG, partial [Clostridia bacterium]|nr:endolytic transglycosylase MltG [Clostridia bacterium]